MFGFVQNRWPDVAFPGPDFQLPEFSLFWLYLANYEKKGIRITPKSIIVDKNIINNSKKT